MSNEINDLGDSLRNTPEIDNKNGERIDSKSEVLKNIEYVNLPHSHLFKIALSFLEEHSLCLECIGRQFSYLSTETDNFQRGKSILQGLLMDAHYWVLKDSEKKIHFIDKWPAFYIIFLISKRTPLTQAKKLWIRIKKNHPLRAYKNHDDLGQDVDKSLIPFLSPLYSEDSVSQTKHPNKSFTCYLCENTLEPENVSRLLSTILKIIEEYDFESFLIGTHAPSYLIDREDEFRARYSINTGESYKANLNRIIGKALKEKTGKKPDLAKPDLVIKIFIEKSGFSIKLWSKPLYIKTRYRKFTRSLPQTHWHCFNCRGKGIDPRTKQICEECNGTGNYYESSIEDIIGSVLLSYSKGKRAILHGAGREDVDAQCLGKGRPIVMEIKEPKKRILPLAKITQEINTNYGDLISVAPLEISNKKEILTLKEISEKSKKTYRALIYLAQPLTKKEFDNVKEEIESFFNKRQLFQRTPLRVVHRRADKTRIKKVYSLSLTYVDPVHIIAQINAQAGTYIKEFISGDEGRTNPSLWEKFNIPMVCAELDVIEIDTPELF